MVAELKLVERVRTLVRDVISIEVPTDETDLIDSGLIDSLTLITMIAEIELEFQVELALDDLDVEQFRTVQRIAQLLDRAAGGLEKGREVGSTRWSSSAVQPDPVANGIGRPNGLTAELHRFDPDPRVAGRD